MDPVRRVIVSGRDAPTCFHELDSTSSTEHHSAQAQRFDTAPCCQLSDTTDVWQGSGGANVGVEHVHLPAKSASIYCCVAGNIIALTKGTTSGIRAEYKEGATAGRRYGSHEALHRSITASRCVMTAPMVSVRTLLGSARRATQGRQRDRVQPRGGTAVHSSFAWRGPRMCTQERRECARGRYCGC